MNKTIRIITLVLALAVLLACTAMTAFADAGDGGEGGDSGYVDPGNGGEGGDNGGDNNIDPGIDPGVDPGIDPDAGGNSGDNGNYVDPGSGGDNGGYTPDYGGGSDGSGSDGGGYSQQTYVDTSPLYYGDASNYDYNNTGDNDRDAGSIDAPQYSVRVGSSDNIKAQQWENLDMPNDQSNIKLNSGSADGDVNFGKAGLKDNAQGSDNMQWAPYLGVVLVALAVLGILYFIVATITQRRSGRSYQPQPAGAYADGYGSAPRRSSSESRGYSTDSRAGRSSSRGYYPETRIASADDFKRENLSRSRSRTTDGYSPSSRRGAKADTGEINLPRRYK